MYVVLCGHESTRYRVLYRKWVRLGKCKSAKTIRVIRANLKTFIKYSLDCTWNTRFVEAEVYYTSMGPDDGSIWFEWRNLIWFFCWLGIFFPLSSLSHLIIINVILVICWSLPRYRMPNFCIKHEFDEWRHANARPQNPNWICMAVWLHWHLYQCYRFREVTIYLEWWCCVV